MDYQNGLLFPGQHQQNQQGQQFFNSPSPVPHAQPPPSTVAGLYPDPQTRFSQQAPQYNGPSGFPLPAGGTVASSGPMMQPPHNHQQPRGPPQNFYSSAPFSQAIPSSATPAPASFAGQVAQPTKTFSPPSQPSPFASPANPQHQAQPEQMLSTPMAAKTMNLPPNQPMPQGARPMPQSPVSAETQTRERERVTLLLEINAELLQELTNLQNQGKGGYTGVPPSATAEGPKPPDLKPASKEYIEILRRLQANLSYLATTAERAQKPNQSVPVPPGPAVMVAPPTPPAAAEMYAKLQTLFPGWKGQPVKQSPGLQQRTSLPQANNQGSPPHQPVQPTGAGADS